MDRPTTGGRYIRKNGALVAAPERVSVPEPASRKNTRAPRVTDSAPNAEPVSQAKADAPNSTEDNPS